MIRLYNQTIQQINDSTIQQFNNSTKPYHVTMSIRIKKIILVIVHLLFWAVVGYLFLANSFLRPRHPSLWVEVCALLCIVALFYVSYFVLVPKLLMRRCFVPFFVCTFLLILLNGFIELAMMEENLKVVYGQIGETALYKTIRWNIFFFLCLRDACFIIVGDIAKLCELQAVKLQQRDKTASEINDGCIFVDIPSQMTALLAIDDIAYLTYEKRRVTIVRKTAPRIYTYASLTYFEEHLPSDQFIRINRNTIAAYSVVESYNETTVCLVAHNIVKDFPIQPTKSEDILDLLQTRNPSKYQPD